jgi:Fe-S oxidoreductase/nitrate reductase gamma subunit
MENIPFRENFWNVPEVLHIVVYVTMAIAVLALLWQIGQHLLMWLGGRPLERWDHLGQRLWRLMVYVGGQRRLFRRTFGGIMHAGLFYGMLILFLGTAVATIDADFVPILKGPVYLAFEFALDLFGLLLIVGVLMGIGRRLIQRPQELTLDGRFYYTLGLLFIVALGGFLIEGLRLAVIKPWWGVYSFVGWGIAQVFLATDWSEPVLRSVHTGVWTFHLITVAVLIATLPQTTLWHVLAAPVNVFFSSLKPKGALPPAFNVTGGDGMGVGSITQFSWKALLDFDACTECGRCQAVCPAAMVGTPLSPKKVIVSLRDHMLANRSALHARGEQRLQSWEGVGRLRLRPSPGGEQPGPAKGSNGDRVMARPPARPSSNGETMIGDVITPTALWSCTTCRACMEECPILVEHVPTIVEMRRFLVSQGQVEERLQDTLMALTRYGNSFGQSDRARARWTQGLPFKIKDARREPVEYLWFVGDYASYDPRAQEVTRTVAALFHEAGLDFGILYEGERNAGNDVRRVGEEGLFELLVEKNIATLKRCTFGEIVTTDPHTYNTLKNEYPAFGASYPVVHYTELLWRLIREGRLPLRAKVRARVTYQDPCYLGRYNGIYEEPRWVLKALGVELVEMPRSRDRALCCAAGGGRIWMEDQPGIYGRPSESRIREATALDRVSILVVACPKDLVMFLDAVKTTGCEGKMAVRDLAQLVAEAVQPGGLREEEPTHIPVAKAA